LDFPPAAAESWHTMDASTSTFSNSNEIKGKYFIQKHNLIGQI
jgi:hypothetical protein